MIKSMGRLAPINILLVGNNPIELSKVQKSINSFKKGFMKATFLFDLKMLKQSISNLNPSAIFIDDNYNLKDVRKEISRIHSNTHTSHIPITLLKSSNYSNFPKLDADDFILKSNLSGKSIYNSVLNGRRFRISRIYFKKVYRVQKGRISDWKEKLQELF